MTSFRTGTTCGATPRWSLAMLASCLSVVAWAGAATLRAQSDPRAEANQLHTAIINGDVESVRYWLDVRHADASAANAAEPDVTPLERCVGLAARTLDAPRSPAGQTPAPVVRLRTLQTMAALLHEHGARLTGADRSQFSEPVLRWYDDAVSPSPAPAQTRPEPARTTAEPTNKPGIAFGVAAVLLETETREACNGNGHAVYLVNQRDLSITANVTIEEDAAGTTNGRRKRETHAVDADGSWRLGCDVSTDGRSVRYVLNDWR